MKLEENICIAFRTENSSLLAVGYECLTLVSACCGVSSLMVGTGDKNISILHLSCRTSDLQFNLPCKHMHLSFKKYPIKT